MIDCEFECDPSGPNNDVHADRCPIALESRIAHLESLTASAVAKEAALILEHEAVGRAIRKHSLDGWGIDADPEYQDPILVAHDKASDAISNPGNALTKHDAEIVKPLKDAIRQAHDRLSESNVFLRDAGIHSIMCGLSDALAPAVGPDESRL